MSGISTIKTRSDDGDDDVVVVDDDDDGDDDVVVVDDDNRAPEATMTKIPKSEVGALYSDG